MTQYKIEDVPVQKKPARTNYPFGKMGVGQSFVVPKEAINAVRAAAWAYGKDHNMKFSTAREDNGDFRIGRVA